MSIQSQVIDNHDTCSEVYIRSHGHDTELDGAAITDRKAAAATAVVIVVVAWVTITVQDRDRSLRCQKYVFGG